MNISEISTPSLLLDVERVRRNAARIREFAQANNVRLRPHIKTHKCVEVARIQTEGFDGAITVSTLEEARAFTKFGFSDITYAVPIEPGKFEAAALIVRDGIRLSLLTDDLETAHALESCAVKSDIRFDVFLKVDCGYHRCGVEPETREAIEIPRAISNSDRLNFAGILTHAGHSYNVNTREEIVQIAERERDSMVGLKQRLNAEGIEVPTVSIGSTPSITHLDHLDGIDEIRPGNYIFFDAFQAMIGSCSFDDPALTVLASVVHRDTVRKKLVVDAGAIALSKDRGAVDVDPSCGYGRVIDLEGNNIDARIVSLSQEHGQVFFDADDQFHKFSVGDRLRIMPNHSCLTAAQHAHYNVVENGEIVDRWEIHRGW